MASTTNYGWTTPDNSGLVKNGAQDIRTLGDAVDTALWNVGYGQAGKNKVINGDFGIWQRGTSFSLNTEYTADRWTMLWDGSGATRLITRQSFTPGTAPVSGYEGQYFLRFAQSVAGSSSTYNVLNQRIEDVRTFAGQTVTFSFWAKASASISMATPPALNQNFGSGGSSTVYPGFTGTAPALTTSWQRFSFTTTVPSVAGKTIGAGSYLEIGFNMPLNTTFTIDIWGVQLEYGSKATPFETATGTIQGELAACQRYYWRYTNSSDYKCYGTGIYESTTLANVFIQNPVSMRVAPTSIDFANVLLYDGASGQTITGIVFNTSGQFGSTIKPSIASGGTVSRACQLLTANGSVAYLGFNAEL